MTASPPNLEHLHHLAITARDGLQAFGINIPPTGPFVPIHHEHLLQLLDATNPDRIAAANARHQQLPHGWLGTTAALVSDLSVALARRDIDAATTTGRDLARAFATAHQHLQEIHA